MSLDIIWIMLGTSSKEYNILKLIVTTMTSSLVMTGTQQKNDDKIQVENFYKNSSTIMG